jgi:hypothetical protein
MTHHTGHRLRPWWVGPTAALAIALPYALPAPTSAQTGAVGNGNWSNVATWTNGVPGTSDDAYIGSIYPVGAASSARVTLSQITSAGNVYLGYGATTSGTLDLNGFDFSVTSLYLGQNGGAGSILRTGGGAISVSSSLYQNSGAFLFAPSDVVSQLYVANGAMATTVSAGNLTTGVEVDAGSILTLGANLSVSGSPMDVRGTLNANGHAISSSSIDLGLNGGPFILSNRGAITTTYLKVSSQFSPTQTAFNVTAADRINDMFAYGVNVSFSSGAGVGGLHLFSNGANPPTYSSATVAGNIGTVAEVGAGCTMTLGGNLTLQPAELAVLILGGTLNANGHAISAATIGLGTNDGPFSLINRGPITSTAFYISSRYSPGQTTFNLTSADKIVGMYSYGVSTTFPPGASVQNLFLYSNGATPPTYSTATTSNVGNITNYVYLDPGATLTMGADLGAGQVDVNGTLNANAHAITASTIYMGYNAGRPAVFQNDGPVTATMWDQSNGTQIRLNHAGDALGTLLLEQSSTMTIGDAAGQMTGLTIGNASPSGVELVSGSDLSLEVNGLASGWVFRWADPSGGDHIADLQNFINGGEMTFSYLNGGSYTLTTDGSYTYINVVPVPEPSSFALLGAAAIGLARAWRRQRLHH